MEIIYTQDNVEGEPGPNLYWRGRPSEFVQLLVDAHRLGVSPGVTLRMEDLPYIRLSGINSFTANSSEEGGCLTRMENGSLLSDLKSGLWREFLHNVLSISFYRSHVYQELSVSGLTSEVNIIMSSEE